jgi:hypothetical protein
MMAPSGQRQSKGPFGHAVMVTPVAQVRFASATTTGIVACALVLVTLPVTFPGCFTVSPLLMLPHNADALIDPRSAPWLPHPAASALTGLVVSDQPTR